MDSQVKREKILTEAKRIFALYGYKKTTIEDIAEAVGMTKSNLYFYVENKADLYDKVIRRALEAWHTEVIDALEGEQDLKRRLEKMARGGYEHLRKDTELCQIVIHDPTILSFVQREDRFSDVNRRSLDSIVSVLEEGIEQGAFRPLDVQLVSEFLFSIYVMQLIKTFVKHEESSDRQFEQALDIVLRGISCPEPA